jgi:hypothetical protein
MGGAEQGGGTRRDGGDRLEPIDAQPSEPREAVTEASRASRERAVRSPGDTSAHFDLDRPEPVVAITETGRGDR